MSETTPPDTAGLTLGYKASAEQFGARDLVFHAPGHDQRRFMRHFASTLAPKLRQLSVPVPGAAAGDPG